MDRHKLAEELKAEHHALEAMAGRAKAMVLAGRSGCGLDRLAALLVDLEEHLRRHLALEEQDGYMAVVLQEAPRLTAQVERLQGEHARLRSELAECIDGIKQLRGFSSSQWPGLQSRCEAWFRLLERHEAEENALVQQTLLYDVGAGD